VGKLTNGTLVAGGEAVCQVDYAYRMPVASNHTATHLLNFALKKHLDQDEVLQKGSLVDSEKLRFDFNHNGPVPLDRLELVEKEFAGLVEKEMGIYTQEVPQPAAIQIEGLRAVFGETYPENVRVVSVGKPIKELLREPNNTDWTNYSVEFCGGTHVDNSRFMEEFVVLHEEGISKGVRRLVATTRSDARQAIAAAETLALRITQLSVIKDADNLVAEVAKMRSEMEAEDCVLPLLKRRALETQLGELKKKALAAAKKSSGGDATSVVAKLAEDCTTSGSVFAVSEVPTGANGKLLTAALSDFEKKAPGKAGMLVGVDQAKGKYTVKACVPASMTSKMNAVEWIQLSMVKVCGGKGGGKPETAMGSGDGIDKVKEALEEAAKVAAAKFQ